jgi:AbrB family looped-hinge helix DNA binding protein
MGYKITSKGQVTIPQEVREQLGLLPHTEVEFVVVDGVAQIRKVGTKNRRGAELVRHMRGRATVEMSTDEIMALTRGDD